MKTPLIAIMASGSGSTAEAFIRASVRGDITSQPGLIIVSRQDAGVFDRITRLNSELGISVECQLISSRTHPAMGNEKVERGFQTVAEEAAILDVIQSGHYDVIALMGYMKRLGKKVIKQYGWLSEYKSIYEASIVNTHPGLLPDTKSMYGRQIQDYVLERKLPYAGQTLHLVSEEYDEGPIISEHRVEVLPNDDADSLFARVQSIEKKYVPLDIDAFAKARIAYTESLKGDR
jgi:phosphoribosylglycinamide formyltransferase-1